MKTSQLITMLIKAQAEYGDLDVVTLSYDTGHPEQVTGYVFKPRFASSNSRIELQTDDIT